MTGTRSDSEKHSRPAFICNTLVHVLFKRQQHRKAACGGGSACTSDADLDDIGGGRLPDAFYEDNGGGLHDATAREFFRWKQGDCDIVCVTHGVIVPPFQYRFAQAGCGGE